MEVFVFSYNRGAYLRNCLESILRHAPSLTVTVYDDFSTDPEVLQVLQEYGDEYTIVRNEISNRSHYVGGLYSNMNRALQDARSDIALFIQDDMQLIRDVDEKEIEYVRKFFDAYPHSVELHTGFLKGRQRSKKKENIEIDHDVPVYFRRPEGKGSINFSAVGVIHVERLNRDNYSFSGYEADNDARIGQRYSRMGISPYPWMMWLPFSETSKFRKKGIFQRYAEWKTGAGFYPYRSMKATDVERLLSRDPHELPYAEDWLTPIGMPAREIWNFSDASKFVPITRKLMKFRKKIGRKGLRLMSANKGLK